VFRASATVVGSQCRCQRYRWHGKYGADHVVADGCLDLGQLLLNHNADVNAKDFKGNTALLHAAAKGCVDLV